MRVLYLLTEDDFDDLIYEAIAERVTGVAFQPVRLVMRKGSGIGAVHASLTIALSLMRKMTPSCDASFIIAVDNDRAPNSAAGEALSDTQRIRLSKLDAHKDDRYKELKAAVRKIHESGIPLAIAVPVEMIESWLLLIAEGGPAADLPRFARQDSASAKEFHHPALPPLQLKDRASAAAENANFSDKADWALDLITVKLDPDELANRSGSFALFKQWLDSWPKG